jgi:hypothetical protein
MKKFSFLLSGTFFCTALSYMYDDEYALPFKKNVALINTVEAKNSFVTYVLMDGEKYIVKQKKNIGSQFSLVRGALAAYIAENLAIAHRVKLVSYKESFIGKVFPELPAAILTIAQGEDLSHQKGTKYGDLRIDQKSVKHAPSFEKLGLTHAIIEQMTWHEQLPLVIAVDLITGNSGTHPSNIFYHPITDKFCMIDMDNTFNQDLCGIACEKLVHMLQKGETFSKKEKKALAVVKKTLSYFVAEYPPDNVVAQMYYYAKKAGFVPGSPLYSDHIKTRMATYEKMIYTSYKSAKNLIILLGEIIKDVI